MNITLVGIVVIVLSIYAFFKNEKLLLDLLVFLSTFTALEVIDIKQTTTLIQSFEVVGVMWLLREIINFVKLKPKISKEIIVNKFKTNKIAVAFLIFMMTIILSEIALAVSGISIDYTDLNGNIQTVQFSISNVTQPIMILFIFVLMIALSFKIKTKEEIKRLIKVFCISSIFAVIWGLLQFITFYLRIPYPAFLFNNNVFALQYYGQIDNNIKRISSIALEPSTFAINLICFLPFLIGAFLKIKGNFKDKKNVLIFILLVLTTTCAILTTSSTAYIGLTVVYGLFLFYVLFWFIKNGELSNKKQNFMKIAVVTIISILLAVGLCITFVKIGYKLGTIEYIEKEIVKETEPEYNSAIDNILSTLKQMTIGKLKSQSGNERIQGETTGMSMLRYSPIFGIGYCSYRTFNLLTNILLNMGIIGLGAYLYILYVVIKELIKYRKKDETISIVFLFSIIGTTVGFFVRGARFSVNILLDYYCIGV